jgi:2-octaprenyl-6-methoxyphenol hydroxylase
MQRSTEIDIAVVGTGPVGLVAALALARAGFSVTLAGPEIAAQDRRTTALMQPSLVWLRDIGVTEAIEASAAPLRSMRIVDATGRLVRSPTVTFRAAEIGEDSFGWNVPNAALLSTLADLVADEPGIRRVTGRATGFTHGPDAVRLRMDDGSELSAALLVAADGRDSPAREAAGITTRVRELDQSALVLSFGHQRDHESISTEFHTEAGPFTQVPLRGRRSSLVWVMRRDESATTGAMSDAELALRIEEMMQSMLGRIEIEPGRQLYPLSTCAPSRFAARRTVLVGEAAHRFPPIGAQGLNLGIRDVQQLVEMADENRSDPGSENALRSYDMRRRPDILARSTAVDLLNRSLLSGALPAQLARAAGLGLLGAASPLRAFFMREGLRTGSGFAALLPASGK